MTLRAARASVERLFSHLTGHGACELKDLGLESNSTPGAVDAGIEASTNAVTDGRFFVRGCFSRMVVAALQRAARILLAIIYSATW